MKNEIRTKEMKRDCARYMKSTMAASCIAHLSAIAVPVITSWMIGNMADGLLTLDMEMIRRQLPWFACAVLLQVVGVSLAELSQNLSIVNRGYAYTSFLIGKLLRLPLFTVQAIEPGEALERLQTDAFRFNWNQVVLWSYIPAIALYAVLIMLFAVVRHCHPLFFLTMAGMAALPVLRTAYVGKNEAELRKKVSEYSEDRRSMEQELFSARDFAVGFGVEFFFTSRLEDRFDAYMKQVGAKKSSMDTWNEVTEFLCTYGAQAIALLVGAVLVSVGEMTTGALVSGYLMIPSVTNFFTYIRKLVIERHNEEKYAERLAFFYEPSEEEEAERRGAEEGKPASAELTMEHVTFRYPGQKTPVLADFNLSVGMQENIRIVGANGSGKSTVLNLLAGLCAPEKGIVCDGAPLSCLRQAVALCDQSDTIFSGTVEENLFLCGDKREQAAELLTAMGFVKPLSYQVTPGGRNLSPGERKKLLLTRALMKDAVWLALDEPLNHLDQQGTQVLVDQLEKRPGGLILISHSSFLPEHVAIRERNI